MLAEGSFMLNQRAFIDSEKCQQCSKCLAAEACPASAIEREEDDEPYFVNAFCQGCGQCVSACPNGVLRTI